MYLLLDIGGSKLRIATSVDHLIPIPPQIFSTPQNLEEALKLITQAVSHQPEAVCAGVAGTLNHQKSELIAAPHLHSWIEKPIKQSLENNFSCPIFLENDAALATLGEALEGAGKGYKIVAYLTISTGVGGARVVNGRLDETRVGFEPGHMIVDQGKDLESFISGTAIEQKYGIPAQQITDEKIWEEVVSYLGLGIQNIIVEWSPDIIVLGGGVSHSLPLALLQRSLEQKNLPYLPKIVKSNLGDTSALWGGIHYLKQNLS